MKRIVLPLLILALQGCSSAQNGVSYRINPENHVRVLRPILLSPVGSAPALMSRDLLYRLRYKDDTLHPYAYSRWYDTPADIFAMQLRQAGVLSIEDPHPRFHCALRVEITSFEQVFTDANRSHAEAKMRFSLMDLNAHRDISHDALAIEVPSKTEDAKGGAEALEAASRQAAREIIEWLNRQLGADAVIC